MRGAPAGGRVPEGAIVRWRGTRSRAAVELWRSLGLYLSAHSVLCACVIDTVMSHRHFGQTVWGLCFKLCEFFIEFFPTYHPDSSKISGFR